MGKKINAPVRIIGQDIAEGFKKQKVKSQIKKLRKCLYYLLDSCTIKVERQRVNRVKRGKDLRKN